MIMREITFSLQKNNARKNKGVVLVVVLIFMLALSTIAVFASRNFIMGEKQSRNELEYQTARQAAEAALRDAERDLRLSASVTVTGAACPRSESIFRNAHPSISEAEFTEDCLQGQCKLPAVRYTRTWKDANDTTNKGEPWWPTTKGGVWNDAFINWNSNSSSTINCNDIKGAVPFGLYTGVGSLPGVARQPEYIIEYLSPAQDGGNENQGYDCPVNITTTDPARASADIVNTTPEPQTLNMPCHLFRLTARGFGPSINAQVLMQSYLHIIK